jgi:myosin heavy subunit
VISGESGAGKTENAHMVLSYLVNRATATADPSAPENQNQVEDKLLKSSPILEAFGNAKSE